MNCLHCNTNFDNLKNYIKHYQDIYENKLIEYKCCKRFFTNIKTFSKHLVDAHFQTQTVSNNEISIARNTVLIESSRRNNLHQSIVPPDNFKNEFFKILIKFLCDKSSSRNAVLNIAQSMMTLFKE